MNIESSETMKMSASRDWGRGFLILRRPERAVSKDEEPPRSDKLRPRASTRLLRRLLSMRAKLRHSPDDRLVGLMGSGDVRL
ncbi:hypothetical protein D1O30_00420 [Methylocystis hirsuta]|uniref:Uncharacterized protein n=1 Tax=Methylocystis hirsuta TaxID=369798 RepID=A0A3M9XJX9_9HYPH|nr:hypothetical protein D1O30_00420 [Methylocystis hirsuta]